MLPVSVSTAARVVCVANPAPSEEMFTSTLLELIAAASSVNPALSTVKLPPLSSTDNNPVESLAKVTLTAVASVPPPTTAKLSVLVSMSVNLELVVVNFVSTLAVEVSIAAVSASIAVAVVSKFASVASVAAPLGNAELNTSTCK